MHIYLNILGLNIPSYGFFIAIGVIVANIVAMMVLKYRHLSFIDFIILEGYCLLGAFIGAKALYVITIFKEIDWSRITELEYFNSLLTGGFVFYGGLILGIVGVLLAGKIHHIDSVTYIRNCIFVAPLGQAFGRIGCFMAGCCYGIEYTGPGAVVFPEGSAGLSGVSLFPVQLVESGVLFAITALLLFLQLKHNCKYTIEIYVASYSIARFFLEYLRFDEVRGFLGPFSTSQWISIGLILLDVVLIIREIKKEKTDETKNRT